ncbi:hypothetical protein BDV96DRAFT_637350 [Lophiotrema nucula]|uniref:Uncharacterized protein n=1 Tax=Lophiotrema nucula TaxID=690887 RepID=A0A6A5YKG2_9PLEO|nr:hypothetical protein BDV96DRAFT_637350 [Lophiotrema nucula]
MSNSILASESASKMADPDEDIDSEQALGIAHEDDVALPNFQIVEKLDAQWIIDTVDTSRPVDLQYRGYVPFRRFNWGFEEFEVTVQVDLQNATRPMSCQVCLELPRKTLNAIRSYLRSFLVIELEHEDASFTIISAGLALRVLEEGMSFYLDYRKGEIPKAEDKKDYWDLTKTNNLNPMAGL